MTNRIRAEHESFMWYKAYLLESGEQALKFLKWLYEAVFLDIKQDLSAKRLWMDIFRFCFHVAICLYSNFIIFYFISAGTFGLP